MKTDYEINIGQIISDDFVLFNEGHFPYSDIKEYLQTIIMNLSIEKELGEKFEDVIKNFDIKTNDTTIQNGNILDELANRSYLPIINMGYVYSVFPDITLTQKDEHFPLFFSLKLDQLALDDIDEFLCYHLKSNFNKDLKKFKRFLELRYREHKNIISDETIETAKEWDGECESLENEKNTFGSSKKEAELPKGYSRIPGKLTSDEIIKFFSFLYLEKGNNEKPLLPKGQVEELLKYGLAVPAKPLGKMFLLNITSHQKGLIKYCFYKAYEMHKEDIFIKNEFTKFLAFNFEQFKPKTNTAITKYLENLSKNFTGEKPAKIKFDIKKYLPLSNK